MTALSLPDVGEVEAGAFGAAVLRAGGVRTPCLQPAQPQAHILARKPRSLGSVSLHHLAPALQYLGGFHLVSEVSNPPRRFCFKSLEAVIMQKASCEL